MARPRNNPIAETFERYGMLWHYGNSDLEVEMCCIRKGGQWKKSSGKLAGLGLFHHYKRGQEILWPEKKWNRWADLDLKCYLDHTYIGVMGCAAAGKSDSAASNVLFDWFCQPSCTTVLVSSTGLKELELRVWGMVKKYFRMAKERYPGLPGNLIEGKQMIVLDSREAASEGRDFRNGLCGVACKRGDNFVGLGPYVGIHNKRVRLLADELNLMPRAFLDSSSNLSKCPDFKLLGLGNPNDTINAHGVLCEPASDLGGWEGGIDQSPKTKTWRTKWPNGICLQKPGSDSPNFDVGIDQPIPFPFLMTRQQMKDDAAIWGVDDWHFTMMNEARMPRGQGSRRIITRQQCEKFGALNEAVWRDTNRTKIAFLDAAYRGIGGDRCVFGEFQFGLEVEMDPAKEISNSLISQIGAKVTGKTIIALVDLQSIPISAEKDSEMAEDQIVKFVKKQCEARGIPPQQFFYDSGMRTSLVSAFSRSGGGWEYSVSIDCGGTPTERPVSGGIEVMAKDYYSKLITEFWYSVRLTIEAGQFRQLTREAMWEFAAREWKHVGNNKIEAESKEEMKKKTGRSPDLADAIAIGLEGARRSGFVIGSLSPRNQTRVDHKWKKDLQEQARKYWQESQLTYN